MPALIHFALDPFSRRMRLGAREYGVGVDFIEETPWDPSHDLFELNPAGTVPVYLEDSTSPVSGVEAIGEFLEETKSARTKLIPGDVFARAEVRRIVGWFDVKFYAEVSEPLITERVIRRYLPREKGGGGPDMGGCGRPRSGCAIISPISASCRPPHLARRRGPLAGRSCRGSPCLGCRLLRRCSVV